MCKSLAALVTSVQVPILNFQLKLYLPVAVVFFVFFFIKQIDSKQILMKFFVDYCAAQTYWLYILFALHARLLIEPYRPIGQK